MKGNKMELGLMKLKELAKELGVCEKTIRNWMKAGLPARYAPGSARVYFSIGEVKEWVRTWDTKHKRSKKIKDIQTGNDTKNYNEVINALIDKIIPPMQDFAKKKGSKEDMATVEQLKHRFEEQLRKYPKSIIDKLEIKSVADLRHFLPNDENRKEK